MPNACRKEPGHRLIQKCDKDDKGSGAQCNLCLVNRTTEQRHSETRTQMEAQQGEGGGEGQREKKKRGGGKRRHLWCVSLALLKHFCLWNALPQPCDPLVPHIRRLAATANLQRDRVVGGLMLFVCLRDGDKHTERERGRERESHAQIHTSYWPDFVNGCTVVRRNSLSLERRVMVVMV